MTHFEASILTLFSGSSEKIFIASEELGRFFSDIENGNEEAVKEAIVSGRIDVDVRNEKGFTSMYVAAFNGQDSIIELLSDLGSTTMDVPCLGVTPLHAAVKLKNYLTVATLVQVGSDAIDTPSGYGLTPMHSAAKKGGGSIGALLCLGSKSIDALDKFGVPPIRYASYHKSSSIRALILMGADYSSVSDRGTVHVILKEIERNGGEEFILKSRYMMYFDLSLVNRLLFEVDRHAAIQRNLAARQLRRK